MNKSPRRFFVYIIYLYFVSVTVADGLRATDTKNLLSTMEYKFTNLKEDVAWFLDSRIKNTNNSNVLVCCSLRCSQELLYQVMELA